MRTNTTDIELKVHIAQDEETGVWFIAASDVPGLRVEGETADELIRKVEDVAPELVELNIDEIMANVARKAKRAAKAKAPAKPRPPQRPAKRPRTFIRPVFDSPLAVAC